MERRSLLTGSLLFGTASVVKAQLRTADAASAGMSTERLSNALRLLETETSSGRVLAASLLLARVERIVLLKCFGLLSPYSGRCVVLPDHLILITFLLQ